MAVYVETVKAEAQNKRFVITGFGNVAPFKEVTLTGEVSGDVIYVNKKFHVGGFFKKEEVILKIDDRDYRDDLIKKKATLASLREDLKLEIGKQRVALKEYSIAKGNLGKINGESLYLIKREPYIRKLLYSIKKAKADVDLAERKLEKCVIRAPFDCYVLNRYIDKGAHLSIGGRVADVVAASAYYVNIYIPSFKLKWLGDVYKDPVKLVFDNSKSYTGRIVSVSPQVDKKGLMAELVVYVKGDRNPVSPLKINNYAYAEIEGKMLKSVTRLPVSALRENDRVWIYDNGRLKIKHINVLFSGKRYIYTYDIKPGRDIIVSQIATPIENMRLFKAGNKINNPQRSKSRRWYDKDNKVLHR